MRLQLIIRLLQQESWTSDAFVPSRPSDGGECTCFSVVGLKKPAAAERQARLMRGDARWQFHYSVFMASANNPYADPPAPSHNCFWSSGANAGNGDDVQPQLGVCPCRRRALNRQENGKKFKEADGLRSVWPPLCALAGLCATKDWATLYNAWSKRGLMGLPIHIDGIIKRQCCDLCVSGGTRKPSSLAIYHMKIQSAAVASINVHLAGL